jgi:hypothetical protein
MARQRVLSVVVRLVVLLVLVGGQAGGSMAVRAAPQLEQTPAAAAPSRAGPDAGTPGLPVGATTHAVLQLGSAPEDLDIAGPGTLEIRETAPFTVTVSPPTASVPITFTWVADGHSPYEVVTKGRESTRSLGWNVEGTHLITITAANAAGSITRVRRVRVVPPPRPDLTITGVYYNGDDLYYQIMNAGEVTVTMAHTSTLWVNGLQTDSDPIVHTSLGPDQHLKRVFTHVPICSGTSHAFRVVVDAGGDVDESDELNNEWRQVVPCDAQAPAITRGPAAFDVAQTSATIRWNTDEDADSMVLYGVRRGAFNWTVADRTLTTAHAVTLTGLRPGVTYEYKVQSTDAAGNAVESRPRTFETLAPPVDPPPTPTITMAPDPDHPGAYLVEATFDDASTVAQVAFLLNGEPVGTDYGRRAALEDVGTQGSAAVLPQATPPPVPAEVFKTSFVPYKRGYSRATFLSTPSKTVVHEVTAQVVTWDQHLYVVPVEIQLPSTSEPLDVELEIESPPPDYTIYITGDHTPAGTLVPLQVHAVQYDWACEYAAWSTEADCSEVMHAVESVQVYQGSSLIEHLFPSDAQDYDYQATLDMSNRPHGSYQVKVRAFDTEGQSYQVETYIEVVQQLPSLDLTREVDRFGNRFRVRLTVENLPQATGAAHLHEVKDYVRSFQVASNHEPGYEVLADYNWGTGVDAHENAITIDFPQAPGQTYDLDPGESIVLEYWMVPIMYEDGTTFEIGQKDVEVSYHGPSGETRVSAFVRKVMNPQFPASDAFEDANYAIVTHPENLAWRNGFSNDVDRLLMTMADLARLRSGVLGYLESDNPRQILQDLVSSGGGWAARLDPAFQTVGGGYLLIVGEEEIVPAWTIPLVNLDLSDQPYSNTGGSGAPDIATGRIIGNTASDLMKPLQASIDVWLGEADFDRSKAWLLTGGGEGQDTFADHIDTIEYILYDKVGIVEHAKSKAIDYHAIDSVAYALSTGDAFALGRVTGGAIVDGVIADRTADVISIIDPTTGVTFESFSQTYDTDDQLAVGNVMGTGTDGIVIGDVSSGEIRIFHSLVSGSFSPGPFGFGPSTHLALGDVNGDGLDEILFGYPTVVVPGALQVYRADGSEVSGAGFNFAFEASDVLASGDLAGGSADEIVIARHGFPLGLISVYDRDGTLLASSSVLYSTYDQMAVGNVMLPVGGKDQIVIKRSGWIYVYKLDEANATLSEAHRMYVPWTSLSDMLATGNVTGSGLEEILLGSPEEDTITWLDAYFCNRLLPVMEPQLPGSDILVYRGHGSPGTWGCVDDFPNGFGNARPLAWGSTCLSGNYEGSNDDGVAEAFFDQNGAAFIGATEVSYRSENYASVTYFLRHWGDGSVGDAFLNLERHYWETSDDWNYWIAEYNLYGDPKFGGVLQLGSVSEAQPQADPPAALTLDLPELAVSSSAGIDYVTMPGGDLWIEEGDVQVPIWQVSYDYPPGLRVQEVGMDERSGLETHTGWVLPVTSNAIDGPSGALSLTAMESGSGWVPSPEVPYTWQAVDNPDGSTTLMLAVYPFFYNPVTTDSEYYRHYGFTITTTTAALTITHLSTGQHVYEPGEQVGVDLQIQNDDPALDVVVEADIQDAGGSVVSGLLLRTLHDLGGSVSFAPTWDSTGTPAGDYRVVVTLRDAEGATLDQDEVDFRLGAVEGEAALIVDPGTFAAGPYFDIELAFDNTGSVPITGTAVVEVYAAGAVETTAVMTTTLANVQPGTVSAFPTVWDATGLPEQAYRVQGQVKYDGRATPLAVVELYSSNRVYLPAVLRQ